MNVWISKFPAPAEKTEPETAISLSWDGFYDLLLAYAEQTSPCGTECKSHLKDGDCKYKRGKGFSFARFDPLHRSNENVLDVSAFAFDVDDFTTEESKQKIAAMFEALDGHSFIVYATHSSRPDHLRLRLMLQVSRALTGAEYSALWPLLREQFKIPCSSEKSKAPSHMFYLPNVPEGQDPELDRADGQALDVDELLKAVVVTKAKEVIPRSATRIERTLEGSDMAKLEEALKAGYWKTDWKKAVLNGDPIGHGPRNNHEALRECLKTDVMRLALDFSDEIILEFLEQRSFRHRDHYGTDPVEEFWAMVPPAREYWEDRKDSELAEKAQRDEMRRRLLQGLAPAKLTEGLTFDRSDTGDRNRFIALYGHNFRHDLKTGWYAWDGQRFARENAPKMVEDKIIEMHRAFYEEARNAPTDEEREALAKYADKCQGFTKHTHVYKFVERAMDLATTPEKFDANVYLFNVENGTLDLRTGQLREHRREDLITKIAPVQFDPTARCPQWEAFLAQIHPDDQELITYLQRFVGYSLTGLVTEQCFLFFQGDGSNGKSTMCGVLLRLFGEYGQRAASDLLVKKQQGSNDEEAKAALRGARLVFCTETDKGQRLNESKLKDLTGEGQIVACAKYEKQITFPNTSKIILSSNYELDVRNNEHAIWRRIRKVPFKVEIPEEQIDPMLIEKLCEELPGILNWALEGCRQWREDPKRLGKVPHTIYSSTAEYRKESDVIDSFVEEMCERVPDGTISARELYSMYADWAERTGEFKYSQKRLGPELRRLGFYRHQGTALQWKGLKRRGMRS